MRKGQKHSEESRKKLSISHLGKKPQEQVRQKMLGRVPWNKGLRLGKNPAHSLRMKGRSSWNKGMRGFKMSQETKEKISNALKNKPKSEEHKMKVGLAHKGKKLSIEHKKWLHELNLGKKLSLETRVKMSEARKGEKCYLWKGGITPLVMQIRGCFKYRLWRSSVFIKDNFTCKECTIRSCVGTVVILNADHIKPFSVIFNENKIKTLEEALNCSELWDINNGQTLCLSCHKEKTFGNVN